MSIDEKAYNAILETGIAPRGLRQWVEAYEVAKVAEQPVECRDELVGRVAQAIHQNYHQTSVSTYLEDEPEHIQCSTLFDAEAIVRMVEASFPKREVIEDEQARIDHNVVSVLDKAIRMLGDHETTTGKELRAVYSAAINAAKNNITLHQAEGGDNA